MQDPNFWTNLLNPDGFVPRAVCGHWSVNLIWLHNASDFFIWTAYLAIPIILVLFAWKRRNELPFHSIFILFGLFIVSCGTTHFMEIVMFYWPVYRMAGLIKFFTAVLSWATVAALIPAIPRALAMKSPEVLQREIEERQRAEAEVRRLNGELEERVRERTAELEAANAAKDHLLLSEKEAREEAEAASRTKDEFLMTLSHELRTPLNAIQGWSSLLSSGRLNEAHRTEALDIIERNVRSQSRLVDDILEVSRIITGQMLIEPHPVELKPVLEAARASVALSATAKEVQIITEYEPGPLQITGDAARLQQIVWNLLTNAIKYSHKGGQVVLSLRRHHSLVEIEVRDWGEGIAPDFLPYVFDRFRQADSSTTRRHGGLGLGLSIVRHLVELQGGTVDANSEGLGKGSTLTVRFPLRAVLGQPQTRREPTVSSSIIDEPQLPVNALEGARILIVDDEAEARHLVSTILTLQGVKVQAASSAREAFMVLQEWKPDLLVSDVGMPEENGYHLIRRVRALGGRFESMPALALTAYASANDRKEALTAGFDSHLAKPVIPETLVQEVGRLYSRVAH